MLGVHELLHDGNPSITEVEQEMVVIRVEFARRVHATRGGFDRHAIAFRRHVQDLEMQAFRERLEKARGHCGDRFPGVPARDQGASDGFAVSVIGVRGDDGRAVAAPHGVDEIPDEDLAFFDTHHLFTVPGSPSSLETSRTSVTSPEGAIVTSSTTLPCRAGLSRSARL